MVRVLIADDEMIERAVLNKTLQKNLGDRCVIYQAENGREALRIYKEKKIQIMILDIEMPGINGIEAAEQIRAEDKECCIIFLTAFDEFAYARKAISVRAMDYLLKPYDEKELMLVMEEAMHEAELRCEREEQLSEREAQSGREQRLPEELAPAGEPGTGKESVDEGPITESDNESVRMIRMSEEISRFVRENYMQEISMQDLAHRMNYSEAYFCKLFKLCFGRNFTSYLSEYRVAEARKLLEEPTINIKEVGKAVGYGDSNYFAKVFKRVTGVSPTEYRTERMRQGKDD